MGQGVECCGLSRNDCHRLMCLNVWPTGSGTSRGCGLVGTCVALSEEVCHCSKGFKVSHVQATPSVGDSIHILLPVDQDVELTLSSFSRTMSACMLPNSLS